MAITARLAGHPFDLEALARLFDDGELSVQRDDEGWYLTSRHLDEAVPDGVHLPEVATHVSEVAAALVTQANGIARSLDSSFRPVSLVGRFTDGGTVHVVVSADVAESRGYAYAASADTGDQPGDANDRQGIALIHLAKAVPDVADAFRILGGPAASLNWFDLYKVFEIVRANLNGRAALEAQGLASTDEITAFENSACHPAVSGSDARHARRNRKPNSLTMTPDEGRAFISRLVTDWTDLLGGAASQPLPDSR